MKKALAILFASTAMAAAAPAFAQDPPGPGPTFPGNCDPATETCTTTPGGGDTTVGVDVDVDVGVDVTNDVDVNNDINIEGDTNTNENTNTNTATATATGGQGGTGNGYGGNAQGGSVGNISYRNSNVNVSAPSVGAAISGDGCTGVTGWSAGIGVAGAGASLGRTRMSEVAGCADRRIATEFSMSADADNRVIGYNGLMNGVSGDVWTPAIQGAAQGTADAETRCGEGATRRSALNAFLPAGCIAGEARATTAPQNQVLIINAPSAEASAEATAPAAARGTTAGAAPRRRVSAAPAGGRQVSTGTVNVNGQQCTVTVSCPAPGR